jgi:hypothetical protein
MQDRWFCIALLGLHEDPYAFTDICREAVPVCGEKVEEL